MCKIITKWNIKLIFIPYKMHGLEKNHRLGIYYNKQNKVLQNIVDFVCYILFISHSMYML